MRPRYQFVRPIRPDRGSPAVEVQGNAPPPAPSRPQRPAKTPLEKNEYARFAAQLAARSERLRAAILQPEQDEPDRGATEQAAPRHEVPQHAAPKPAMAKPAPSAAAPSGDPSLPKTTRDRLSLS